MSFSWILFIVAVAVSLGLLFYSKNIKLGVMMFLEFFVWGAWFVTTGNYMAEIGMVSSVHWVYMTNYAAAIIAPFFIGLVADRYFATEKVLAVLHIFGAVFMALAPYVAEGTQSVWLFVGMMALYNLCYMPTLGLANALTFHHISDQEQNFPKIRVLGTIGWIVAGILVSGVLTDVISLPGGLSADRTKWPLLVGAIASLVLGLYSFTLPHTPPPARGKKANIRDVIGLDALTHLSSRSFWVFVVASMLMCIPLAVYYAYTQLFVTAVGIEKVAQTMTLGQASEVIFLLLMPLMFKRFGVKWMLAMGMLAWVLRYGLFSWASSPDPILWMVITGILLHGICYDFFFVTGQIYVDKRSTEEIRGQAQGFLVLVTYGVGMITGTWLSGLLFNSIIGEQGSMAAWQSFWLYPAIAAGVIMVLFMIFFKDDSAELEAKNAAMAAFSGDADES